MVRQFRVETSSETTNDGLRFWAEVLNNNDYTLYTSGFYDSESEAADDCRQWAFENNVEL